MDFGILTLQAMKFCNFVFYTAMLDMPSYNSVNTKDIEPPE